MRSSWAVGSVVLASWGGGGAVRYLEYSREALSSGGETKKFKAEAVGVESVVVEVGWHLVDRDSMKGVAQERTGSPRASRRSWGRTACRARLTAFRCRAWALRYGSFRLFTFFRLLSVAKMGEVEKRHAGQKGDRR